MVIDNLKPKLQARFDEIFAITSIYREHEWCRKIADQIRYGREFDCGLNENHYKKILESWETAIKNSKLLYKGSLEND